MVYNDSQMTAREDILQSIRLKKPAASALPDIVLPDHSKATVLSEKFMVQANLMRSDVNLFSSTDEIQAHLANHLNGLKTISFSPLHAGSFNNYDELDPTDLAEIEVTVVDSPMGVAENGAVWLSDKECPLRVAPFICNHLVVILSTQCLVSNMHEAYQKVRVDSSAYGSWIGGPSKTADIEQTLVVGAQGAKKMTILLYPL